MGQQDWIIVGIVCWALVVVALGGALHIDIERKRRRPNTLQVDDVEVVLTASDGGVRRVRWDELAQVGALTTDDGPAAEDLFWVLVARDGTGCAVPSELGDEHNLVDRLLGLSGFDHEAFIAACGSTEDARFVLWRRPDAA